MESFSRESMAGPIAVGVTVGIIAFVSFAAEPARLWGDYAGGLLSSGLMMDPDALFPAFVKRVVAGMVGVAVCSLCVVVGTVSAMGIGWARQRFFRRSTR